MELLDFYELATPLTAKYYAESNNGSIYGLEHSVERWTNKELRSLTPIKNYFLTG